MTSLSGELDGNTLRQMRRRRGYHQHQLAAKLKDLGNDKDGINQGRISEWENGVKPIPPRRQVELRAILNQGGSSDRPV